jgi:hypothetical protein
MYVCLLNSPQAALAEPEIERPKSPWTPSYSVTTLEKPTQDAAATTEPADAATEVVGLRSYRDANAEFFLCIGCSNGGRATKVAVDPVILSDSARWRGETVG